MDVISLPYAAKAALPSLANYINHNPSNQAREIQGAKGSLTVSEFPHTCVFFIAFVLDDAPASEQTCMELISRRKTCMV